MERVDKPEHRDRIRVWLDRFKAKFGHARVLDQLVARTIEQVESTIGTGSNDVSPHPWYFRLHTGLTVNVSRLPKARLMLPLSPQQRVEQLRSSLGGNLRRETGSLRRRSNSWRPISLASWSTPLSGMLTASKYVHSPSV